MFLLVLGKVGNKQFNAFFLNFFASIFNIYHNNPTNKESLHHEFLSFCKNTIQLKQELKDFIQTNGLNMDTNNDLVDQFISEIKSYNNYVQYNNDLFIVQKKLKDAISNAIDTLYPIYIAESMNHQHKYDLEWINVNIVNSFHYLSCDIFTKYQPIDLDSAHSNLLFNNFTYKNGLNVLNAILQNQDENVFLPLKLNLFHSNAHNNSVNLNVTEPSYFVTPSVNKDEVSSKQLFPSKIIYSPHYTYKTIRYFIHELYMKYYMYKCNKALCCSVIHQMFDDFCGKTLVDNLIQEIKNYQELLSKRQLDNLFDCYIEQHFKLQQPLDYVSAYQLNQIVNNIQLRNSLDWKYFGNIKNDLFIEKIFEKLITSSYAKDYTFQLLEKILLNNEFTILKQDYCYSNQQTIRPFSKYSKDELDDLTNNNPIFFVPDWLDSNHPNIHIKYMVNNFCIMNDLVKLNIPYSDLWQKLIQLKTNFYQQNKPIAFGIHSKHINDNKVSDSIEYFSDLKTQKINITEYVDIDCNMVHKIYNNRDYNKNYHDIYLWDKAKLNEQIIPNDIDSDQFLKVMPSIFYPYNGYLIKKENKPLNIQAIPHFSELNQYLHDEINKYHQDNSYYIKPIFLKIKSHGLGVSYFLNKFAEHNRLDIDNIDISTLTTYTDLLGLSSSWGNGKTGMLYNIQQKNKDKLSILYVDNFDLMKNSDDNYQNSFMNGTALINKMILKKSRLNYVDEFKVLENDVVDISKIITIFVGEHLPAMCTNAIISSLKVFNIDFYQHHDTGNPNPI